MKQFIQLIKNENYNKGIFLNNNDKLDILIKHCMDVEKIASIFCNRLNNISKEDKELIKVAAILHDIRKWTGPRHNLRGAEYILEEFNNYNKDKEIISLMVRWHKENGYDKTLKGRKLRMVEIVRVSDKIAKLYKINKINIENEYIIAKGKIESLISKDVKREAYKIASNVYREIKSTL